MVMIGGHTAGGFGGQTASQANAAAGLPFAGVPGELREAADEITSREPDQPEPDISFEPSEPAPEVSFRALLDAERRPVAAAVGLVLIETVAGISGPALTGVAIDRGVRTGRFGVVAAIAAAYAVAVVITAVAASARISLTGRITERMLERLRTQMFSHLQRLSLDFFGRNRSGVILSRLTSDIDSLAALFQEGFVNLVVQGLTVVAVTAVLFVLSPTLTALLLLVIVPIFVLLTWWFRSASAIAYSRTRDRIAEVLADLSEHLAGIRVVIASGRGRRNTEAHARVVGRYRDANLAATRIGTVYGPAAEVTGLVGQALVLLVGGRLVLDGRLSLGELTAFVLYLTTFFAPIQQLVQLYNTYQQGSAAMSKLRQLGREEPSVLEAPGATTLPPVEGEIVLRSVGFSYDRGVAVLGDVDLRIPAGQTVALVGPSGAGKTTVARLVARFHDPTHGEITIDGHDLRTVTLASIRSQLGVVPQEPFLFHGSLRDNLAFGRPEADDAEILAACEAVGLSPLIERSGAGLDTPVHERGVSISAGERQLIALGRAMVARPRVLILDEATSNLDLESETRVERALDRLLEGRTAILIAHRLATARRADRIVVIDDGGIAEMGPHDDLVAAGGRYAEMHRQWVAAGGT